MSTELDQALNDLLWERERLNVNLETELQRSHMISKAMHGLQDHNERALSKIIETLQALGKWPMPIEQHPMQDAPRTLRSTQVANGIGQIFEKVA